MTARHAQHALQLLARVARLRELRAHQVLAETMRREDEQRDRVAEADVRLEAAHGRVVDLLHETRLDLARLALVQEVALCVKNSRREAAETLERCAQERSGQSRTASIKTRYRKRIEEHCHEVAKVTAAKRDAAQQQQAIEAWIQRKPRGGQP